MKINGDNSYFRNKLRNNSVLAISQHVPTKIFEMFIKSTYLIKKKNNKKNKYSFEIVS